MEGLLSNGLIERGDVCKEGKVDLPGVHYGDVGERCMGGSEQIGEGLQCVREPLGETGMLRGGRGDRRGN